MQPAIIITVVCAAIFLATIFLVCLCKAAPKPLPKCDDSAFEPTPNTGIPSTRHCEREVGKALSDMLGRLIKQHSIPECHHTSAHLRAWCYGGQSGTGFVLYGFDGALAIEADTLEALEAKANGQKLIDARKQRLANIEAEANQLRKQLEAK